MITAPNFQEPIYTDAQLDEFERNGRVTMDQFCALIIRAIDRMTVEEKADLRQQLLANAQKERDDRLLKMKTTTGFIQ